MVKAVFFDIDGTLLSFNTHRVPQSTIEAIKLLRQQDIKIFVATGRAHMQIVNLDEIEFDGYISLNGAYCFSKDEKVIHKQVIAQEDIEALVAYQQTHPFPCSIVTENEIFMNFMDERVEAMLKLVEVAPNPIKAIEEALHQEVLQIVAYFDKEEEERMLKHVLKNCDATRWHPLFTDVIAKGTSKAAGIDKVMEYYGLQLSEAMSFGDGGNDIPMLKHTPISVAMGNAIDEVKQHATYITDTVDNDGVWKALKHFELI